MDKTSIAQKMGKGIINATANVLSAPAQIKSRLSQRQATSDFRTLKKANQFKGAPERNGNQITEAGMANSLAQDVKDRLTKK